MNNKIDIDNATIFLQHPSGINPPDNQRGEKTGQVISVVSPEQVSSLLALPDELLVKIAEDLPFVEYRSLNLTCRRLNTLFNTEERLKKLANEYYGSASDAYRKIIQNRQIPAVPNNEINDSLLRLAYHRRVSNAYLASLVSNARKISVVTLFGHSGCVRSVTALIDGRLASCSNDQTIKVWDLSRPKGQECVVTLNDHTDAVYSVTQLPDGLLTSYSDDQTIKVWDLGKSKGQQCVETLHDEYSGWVESVTPLVDGRLASWSGDKTVKVWDLSMADGQQCVVTLYGHTSGVSSVTQLPDGRLASCSGDKTIKLWDLSKPDGQQCVATLNGHTDWVNFVTPLPFERLASCSADQTVKVWNLREPFIHAGL